MASSMTCKTFFTYDRNKIHVLVAKSDWEEWIETGRICSLLDSIDLVSAMPRPPIFTFTKKSEYKSRPWLTGTEELLIALHHHIETHGGTVRRNTTLHVPFANGYELGERGKGRQLNELRWRTSGRQFEQVFGASVSAIERAYYDHQASAPPESPDP